ncbi:hypothetical protein M427DRAFT_80007, partial [Gonapodya prolifera JEL478]
SFTRTGESEAKGDWQIRACHEKKMKDGTVSVWDSMAHVEHTYVKAGNQWKLQRWRPHTFLGDIGSWAETI